MANSKSQIAATTPAPWAVQPPASSFRFPASCLAPRQSRRRAAVRAVDSRRVPAGDEPACAAMAHGARSVARAARELDRAQPGPVGAELALARAAVDAGVVWAGVGGAPANQQIRQQSQIGEPQHHESRRFVNRHSLFAHAPHRHSRPVRTDLARLAGDAALSRPLPVHLQPGVLRGDGGWPGMAVAPLESGVCSGARRVAGRGGGDAARVLARPGLSRRRSPGRGALRARTLAPR